MPRIYKSKKCVSLQSKDVNYNFKRYEEYFFNSCCCGYALRGL